MKGATAVLSATLLVTRPPFQLISLLVRVQHLTLRCAIEFTQSVSLTHVVEPPKIITHPQELKDVVEEESAKFSIQASGTEPLKYHWQWKPAEKGSGSEKWQPCPANWSDGATLTVPKVEKTNEGIYRCVVSNLAGEQISNSAKLGVGKNLKFKWYHLV